LHITTSENSGRTETKYRHVDSGTSRSRMGRSCSSGSRTLRTRLRSLCRNRPGGSTMVSRFLTALPVFNEELHVQEVLAEVRKYAGDILVVDDGSTDRTPELLSREMDVRVLTHEVNQGYGAALRTAFEFAIEEGYDALVTIDCDGQHEPSLIPEIVAALDATAEHPLDLVSGSRYVKRFQGDSQAPAERKRINEEITAWLNCKFGWKLT